MAEGRVLETHTIACTQRFPGVSGAPVRFTFCILADTQGFEPWRDISASAPLAGECLRPLGHISIILDFAFPVYVFVLKRLL